MTVLILHLSIKKMTLHLRYCDFLFQKQNFFFLEDFHFLPWSFFSWKKIDFIHTRYNFLLEKWLRKLAQISITATNLWQIKSQMIKKSVTFF